DGAAGALCRGAARDDGARARVGAYPESCLANRQNQKYVWVYEEDRLGTFRCGVVIGCCTCLCRYPPSALPSSPSSTYSPACIDCSRRATHKGETTWSRLSLLWIPREAGC